MRDTSFRHTASFGKRMEYVIIAKMLKEGLDVYVPLVDDNGIDAVVRKPDGSFVEVQIKARSADVRAGDEALFAAINHTARENYWFIFYAEGVHETPKDKDAKPMIWVMSSAEFIAHSSENKTGENVGKRSIWFNGCKGGVSYAKPKFAAFRVERLSDRILGKK